MLTKFYFSIILSLLIFTGCDHKLANRPVPKVIQMPEMSSEIFLPTKMWDLIMGANFEKALQESSGFIYAPISVQFEEKNPGVLIEPVLLFNFPKGGGNIDLSKYIKSDRGTFRLSFNFQGLSDPESLQIYYVSNTRQRKLDDEIYGSGCNKFFDIKKYVLTERTLQLNVTRDRHISAIGGNFIFSYKEGKQVFVSQVGFAASDKPDLFCQDTAP